MKRIITIGLIIIAMGVTGYLIWNKTHPSTQATTYQSEKATRGTLVSSVTASGKVAGTNIASVTTQASGTVKQVFVKEGDTVKAGQKILEISPDITSQQKMSQAYANYLSAKNAVDTANITLYTLQSAEFAANNKFMKDAIERDLATNDPVYIQENADWLAAEAKYKQQSALIAQSQAAFNNAALAYQLTLPVVTAPTSGVITNISAIGTAIASTTSSNSNSTAEEKVAIIENETRPTITVNLSETDVIKVKTGQKATITLDSMPDKTFTGKVTTLDKVGTQTSNVTSYPATITLDADNENILPNMAASASIIVDTKDNVVTVPSAAVQTQNGVSTVRILKNGQTQTIAVETGLSSDTEIEITSGVREGDDVVTSSSSSATTSTRTGTTSVFGGGLGGGAFRGIGGAGGGNTRVIQRN